MDLRRRVIEAKQEGLSSIEVAKQLRMTVRTVDRYWKSFKERGHVEPGQQGGYKVSRLKAHDETLLGWIAKEPDLTIDELRLRLKRRLKVKIGYTALRHRIIKLGLTFKKNAAGGGARSASH